MKKLYLLAIAEKQYCFMFCWVPLALLFVFLAGGQAQAQQTESTSTCSTLDFKKAAPGLISTYTTSEGTVSIFARKRNEDGTYASENHAAIFNTLKPTGGDSDLYTEDWGNALIINQDLGTEPNDNAWGGDITLDFSAIGPVTMTSLKALDFDVYEGNSWVYLYDGAGNELYKVQIQNLGNMSQQTVNLGNTKGVMKLKVVFDGRNSAGALAGSGAIDDISFCVEEMTPPAPSCNMISFEEATPGLISSYTTSEGTVSIFARKRNEDGTYASENHAAIFNTLKPTGGDSDLYTEDWGNALIINQDLGTEPNDNAWGGEMTLDFSAIGPVTMTSLKALDFDVYEGNSWVYLYDGAGNELYKVQIQNLGNMSQQTVNLGNTKGVMKLKVVLDGRNSAGALAGSGAIDDISFCVDEMTAVDANAGADQQLTCAITEVTLTGTSTTPGVSYMWSGPNSFTSTSATPTVAVAGVYTLTVTDPATGATASDQVEVTQDMQAPVILLRRESGKDGALHCGNPDTRISFVASTEGFDFEWVGPDEFVATTPSILVTVPGFYTLTVTNPVTGCQATEVIEVGELTTRVTVDAGEDKVLTCKDQTVTLKGTVTWTNQIGWFMSGEPFKRLSGNMEYVVDKPGTYVLEALDGAYGCLIRDTVVVTMDMEAPNFEFYTDIYDNVITCKNKEVMISVKEQPEGAIYAWTGPNGFTSDQPFILATVVGDYSLTITDPVSGCQTTKYTSVAARYPEVTVSAGPDQMLTCNNPTVTLQATVTGAVPAVHWYNEQKQHLHFGTTLVVDKPGKYVMQVLESESGCLFSDTVVVTMDMVAPNITAQGGTLSSETGTVQLMGSSTTEGVSYSWMGPEGYASTEQNPVVSVAGEYTLTVTDLENGCTSTATVTVAPQATTQTSAISQATVFPNPIQKKGAVEFKLGTTGNYVVELYDLKGNLVRELKAGHAKAGEVVNVEVDGSNLKGGLYMARIVSATDSKTIKVMLKK